VTPILWIALTVAVYEAALWLYARCGKKQLLNPLLSTTLAIILILRATHTTYAQYMSGGDYIGFMLGPATVALAVPLYRSMQLLKERALPIALGLLAGGIMGMFSATAIAMLFGMPALVVRSLIAKSVTTPVAMAISQEIGGAPSLTAAFVIVTGLIGATLAGLRFARRRGDWPSRGLGLGVAAHGIGTSQAIMLDETAGAFSGVGMSLNAVLTSVLAPVAVHVLHFKG
jgi:predicted murein hydrolase (TIGR00659 family)